jgi:hypothetical protein
MSAILSKNTDFSVSVFYQFSDRLFWVGGNEHLHAAGWLGIRQMHRFLEQC